MITEQKLDELLLELFVARGQYYGPELVVKKIRFYKRTLAGQTFADIEKAVRELTMAQAACPGDYQILELCRAYKRARDNDQRMKAMRVVDVNHDADLESIKAEVLQLVDRLAAEKA